MRQIKVQDLARSMGLDAADLFFKLRSLGVPVRSVDDSIDPDSLPKPRYDHLWWLMTVVGLMSALLALVWLLP